MSVTLWHIELSHYNEKARWALDYKGIPHERRVPIPGFGHRIRAASLTRGTHLRLPVMDLEGRRVGDSTAIIAALEDYRPDPPLYPEDAGQRELALELEDSFDEELAPAVRRYMWFHTLPDPDATAAALFTSPSPSRERLLRLTHPVARRVVSADYGIDADSAEASRRTILATMDEVEDRLGASDYLVGDGFSVADLSAAALFTPLLAPPERPYAPATVSPVVLELREQLEDRPGGAWVAEMYARHRGAWVPA